MPNDGAGLIQRRVACALDPLEVLARLGGQPGLTGLIGSWAGGGALITSGPVTSAASIADLDGHPGGAADPREGTATLPDPAGFVGGGWFGVLGYQLGRAFERLPAPPPRPSPVPGLRMSYYDHLLRYDAGTGTWWFESEAGPDGRDRSERHYQEITARLRGPAPAPPGYRFGLFRMAPAPTAHQDAVARCLDHIAAGDIFQANICLRAEAPFRGDPLAAFIRGARALRPAYAAYVTTSHGVVASFSPELFLDRRGQDVRTAPIKGTAPLSADPAGLVTSAKDQAENTMIVDLMRNDLSRVCLPGSVRVPSSARVEAHTGVWHLLRDISGTLRDGVADSQLIRATFPPGSVTGAPKVRAMELISELETTGREAYTGAIGYLSAGRLELNVAIRTFEFLAGTAWIGVGGGIVLDSSPAKEMRECLDKLQPLLTAVGAELGERPLDEPARPPGSRTAPAGGREDVVTPRRPRAGLGVFETMLVTAGEVPRLAAHLDRLSASVRDLYSAALPHGLERRVRARARTCPDRGRLRVTVTPGRDQESITLTPLSSPAGPPVTLVPVQVPGGWGRHKWADRALLDTDGDGAPWLPGHEALLMDGPDLLETGRASLFLAGDDGVCTPRLDGRLLPGTTRRQVIDVLGQAGIAVRERRLTLTDLSRATEVFATNAIRGVTAVAGCTVLPGHAWQQGPLTAWLQSRLRDDSRDEPHAPPRARPAPAPRVLLVDNYDSFVYNLARYCEELGARTTVVRNDEPALNPESIAGRYDHMIISPGPGDPASAGRSVEVVRRLAGVLPILGVCLGHQCIGEAFGGRTVPAPRPVHGRQALIRHDQQGIFAGLPPLLAAGRYHSLVTDESALPGVLIPAARTLTGLLMGVRHRHLPVHGIQVHPESTLTPRGHDLLANFLAIPEQGSIADIGALTTTGEGVR
jgi:para-aminobenzoate synthetase/4-amino-4-deoxychorismate lyase